MGRRQQRHATPSARSAGRSSTNIRQLREARKLTYTELSAKLAKLGRPIPVLGLSRIEKGRRRVDADDLVALALALRVNPGALLLPRSVAAGTRRSRSPQPPPTPPRRRGGGPTGTGSSPRGRGADDFLVHARPEYEVRGKVEGLGRLARDALAKGHRDFADLARQNRDDLSKLARDTLPGFASEARAAACAAWQRQREKEDELTEEDERMAGGGAGEQMTEGGLIAEDRDD